MQEKGNEVMQIRKERKKGREKERPRQRTSRQKETTDQCNLLH